MQVTSSVESKKIDISKELWFFLMFNCVGFTVWPLMVYYLARTLQFSFFLDLSLRTWAEHIVYGPLGVISVDTLRSIAFLLFPYLSFLGLRLLLTQSHKK
tara:strand:+ start:21 stop:320 length:300 start_codon:yes stop_codon:yes gene_type:complete